MGMLFFVSCLTLGLSKETGFLILINFEVNKMSVIVCLFNHKGGVSKTTTVFNLGWMVASQGKRVMLVDCDPQCNLTGMVLEFGQYADLNKITGGKTPKNIRDGLSPAFESRPAAIQPIECEPILENENLFLLPGHIGLAEYETTLGIAQELSGSLVTLRNLPGAFRYLIDATAKKYQIDIVFVDMSPSLGPINQNLLMTSDFFLVPMNPDYFSTMGIDSLTSVLPKWKAWSDSAQKISVLRDADYPFPCSTPKFLGSVIQKYRPRSGNIPSDAFQQWISQLKTGVSDKLIPALEKSGMMLSPQVYEKAGYKPHEPLLQMPDFNSLIAKSQKHRVPVFALSDNQLEQTGIVLETTRNSMNKFKDLFSQAAKRVVCAIENATLT